MAVCFAYSFGQETAAQLQQLGWTISATGASDIAPSNTYQHKAATGVANYSLGMSWHKSASPPSVFRPSTAQGSIQAAIRLPPGVSAGSYPWALFVYDHGFSTWSAIQISAAGATLLYVNGAYKSTSAATYAFDSGFQVLSLFWDQRANPWKARCEVNGAESNAEATGPRAASSPANIEPQIRGFAGTLQTIYGMVVLRDTYAESAPHDRYVTRIGVDSDVSTVGTWAQTGAATNHGCVGNDPFDDAKHLEEATPTPGDNVVCSYTSALGTKLGFAPSTIDAVAVYAFSEGAGLGCAATLGDGSATTTGSTTAINASTTAAGVVASVKPSGGAWSGSDTPRPGFKVVTT